LLVLDEARNPAAPGEIGDLYIAGAGPESGLLARRGKTARAYLPDPRSGHASQRIYKTGDLARVGPEGLVYFHGRADTQIKSRGYRIELGEIESALNAGSDLKECAVVSVATAGFDGAAICLRVRPGV
jgi:non-ribosomal peptide synthetase component F